MQGLELSQACGFLLNLGKDLLQDMSCGHMKVLCLWSSEAEACVVELILLAILQRGPVRTEDCIFHMLTLTASS